jgi:hypothetical protein
VENTFRPIFDIADLVEMCGPGWNRRKVIRLLKAHQVKLHRNGHKYQVMLSDLRNSFPELWNSLVEAEALRAE